MTICAPAKTTAGPPAFIDRILRRFLLGRLRQCRAGSITIEDDTVTQLGPGGDLSATVRVNTPRFYRRLMFGGSLAAADAYIRGQWDCDDLTALFRLCLRNQSATDNLDAARSWLANGFARCIHRWRANTRTGSRRNISAHYDRGNDFFQYWLDDTWAYSCGIFPSPQATLRDASLEKIDRACRKLALKPQDHLLEIGTGWGGWQSTPPASMDAASPRRRYRASNSTWPAAASTRRACQSASHSCRKTTATSPAPTTS